MAVSIIRWSADVFLLLEAVNSAKEAVANETLSYKDGIPREDNSKRNRTKVLVATKAEKQVAESKEDRDIIATRITEINEGLQSLNPNRHSGILINRIPKAFESSLKAQRSYRRAMDDSFNGIETAIQTIGPRPGFSSFVPILDELISR